MKKEAVASVASLVNSYSYITQAAALPLGARVEIEAVASVASANTGGDKARKVVWTGLSPTPLAPKSQAIQVCNVHRRRINRREGKGRRCCLGDVLECRTNHLAARMI